MEDLVQVLVVKLADRVRPSRTETADGGSRAHPPLWCGWRLKRVLERGIDGFTHQCGDRDPPPPSLLSQPIRLETSELDLEPFYAIMIAELMA
jgi:hypothetical protein